MSRTLPLLSEIYDRSKAVDDKYSSLDPNNANSVSILYPVPILHPRSKAIRDYTYQVGQLESIMGHHLYERTPQRIFLVDRTVSRTTFVKGFFGQKQDPNVLVAREDEVKNRQFLDDYIIRIKEEKNLSEKEATLVVVLGEVCY